MRSKVTVAKLRNTSTHSCAGHGTSSAAALAKSWELGQILGGKFRVATCTLTVCSQRGSVARVAAISATGMASLQQTNLPPCQHLNSGSYHMVRGLRRATEGGGTAPWVSYVRTRSKHVQKNNGDRADKNQGVPLHHSSKQ